MISPEMWLDIIEELKSVNSNLEKLIKLNEPIIEIKEVKEVKKRVRKKTNAKSKSKEK